MDVAQWLKNGTGLEGCYLGANSGLISNLWILWSTNNNNCQKLFCQTQLDFTPSLLSAFPGRSFPSARAFSRHASWTF